MSIIVDWNGNDVPRQLKELPAGRYVVESVDDVPELTREEEEGLHEAMTSLRAGKGLPAEDAQRLLEGPRPQVSVVLSPEAVDDLAAAVDYLAERNTDAAVTLVDRAFRLFRRLDGQDFEGPIHTLSDGTDVRSWPLPPFRVYYRREGRELLVLRVYHQRRTPL